MRKVVYANMITLDGFMEGPNQDLGWAIIDEELHRFVNNQEREFGAHLYGRRTYEVMQGYWPTADKDPSALEVEIEYARIWQAMPKIVFSKTLERVEGNARLVREVNPEEIMELKAQPGKDLALGGADLAATFLRLGLIDEYWLYIHPTILGSGTPAFPALTEPVSLRLVETRTLGSGVVFLRYQRSNEEAS